MKNSQGNRAKVKKPKQVKRKEFLINLPVRFEIRENIPIKKLARVFWELGFEITPVLSRNMKAPRSKK